ncbi:MAG TPA: DEAD/DEAH box helicase [Candidatus Limnocylindria bacterium]|nr:DEAD/DEAH box helicase [Candidatus Limnocylindria bacterium]
MSEAASPVQDWFERKFGQPTPAQTAAWPHIRAGRSVLIVSPTGTGKTFAAFFEVLHRLAQDHAAGTLRETIHCLYVSPLRALSYDLEKNLSGPLREIYGEPSPIRVGLRSGDTGARERESQFTRPPHILLTTPESIALLLSQTKWQPLLASVRWVIVDEIHALTENKRGSHLTLSLERLEALRGLTGSAPLQRIGLSATVAPLSEVAAFLSGTQGRCEIVDVSTTKRIDLRLYTPLRGNPYPLAGFSGARLTRALGRLIQKFRTTLVFTNTRSGAEATTYWLKQSLPALADQIECHHASLDRDLRLEVEDRLKRGELRAVVCSTSLEMGIDIGTIDLVVMLSTPKGVSKALQRTGRAGHSIHEISRGLLMATNVNDLVECCATARLARRGHLDAVRIPCAPLDVLAQHLLSMGCLGEVSCDAAYALVRRAFPYRDLSRSDFEAVLDYLAGGGKALRQQYTEVFGKIVIDATRGVYEARAGAVRRDFLQNIGTILNEGVVRIVLRHTQLGTVEEGFISQLRPGDVFMLAGRALRLERVGMMEASVVRADGALPTIPRWGANKMPLSNRVGREIVAFRGELRARLEGMDFNQSPSLIPWIAGRLECEEPNAAIIFRVHAAQHQASEIPTDAFLLVEELAGEPELPAETRLKPPQPVRGARRTAGSQGEFRLAGLRVAAELPALPPTPGPARSRHYFFHSLIGRAANDALARVVALRMSRLMGGNAVSTPDDYGFVLTVTDDQRLTPSALPRLFAPENFSQELDEALSRSSMLKYHFRSAAQTGLMVYRNYFGESKSARKLQWSAEVIFNVLAQHEPDHVLLREARRDTLHTILDAEGAAAFLADLQRQQKPIRLRPVTEVPPLSFGMYATKIKEALMVEDPRETLERLYHQWWTRLGGETEEEGPPGPPRPT